MSAPAGLPAALPMQTRLAAFGSIDAEARTVEVVWTTGATVRRARWVGWDSVVPFDEELLVTDAAVDLSRLKAGAPVLDSHCGYSIDNVRAVVDDAWLASGKGYARLRFPAKGTDEKADRLFELVQQKIVRNISVGYSINQVRIVEPEKKGEVERRIVERWAPFELSFVAVPADAEAQVRAAPDAATFSLDIVGRAAPTGIGVAAAARARMSLRARVAGLH